MIYLDNAATSWPKPAEVYAAVDSAMREHGGNPGRATHRFAVSAERLVEDARAEVSRLFNAPSPERVVFTLNCTDALNLVLKGLITRGDRVVTGPLEHNSVVRPLHSLAAAGAIVTRCQATASHTLDLDHFRYLCRSGIDYVVMQHVSNVTGAITPLPVVAAIAREHGARFIVDAAQSAGCLPIDMIGLGIDALCVPGHKGLCGPMGTGVLVLAADLAVTPFREGGSGGESALDEHPRRYPWRLEGGTCNVPGIAGLSAGVRFVESEGVDGIGRRENALALALADGLRAIDGVRLFGMGPAPQSGVVSFRIDALDIALTGAILDESYGIAVRTGLHCAPLAHRTIGSFPEGTVRASVGPFNSEADVSALICAVREMATQFHQGARAA